MVSFSVSLGANGRSRESANCCYLRQWRVGLGIALSVQESITCSFEICLPVCLASKPNWNNHLYRFHLSSLSLSPPLRPFHTGLPFRLASLYDRKRLTLSDVVASCDPNQASWNNYIRDWSQNGQGRVSGERTLMQRLPHDDTTICEYVAGLDFRLIAFFSLRTWRSTILSYDVVRLSTMILRDAIDSTVFYIDSLQSARTPVPVE